VAHQLVILEGGAINFEDAIFNNVLQHTLFWLGSVLSCTTRARQLGTVQDASKLTRCEAKLPHSAMEVNNVIPSLQHAQISSA
jgi:hypothetical protein